MYLIEDELLKIGFITKTKGSLHSENQIYAIYKDLIIFHITKTYNSEYDLKYSIKVSGSNTYEDSINSDKTARNIHFENEKQLLLYLKTNKDVVLTNILSFAIYQLITRDDMNNEYLSSDQMRIGLECRIHYIQDIMNSLYTNKAVKLRHIANSKNNRNVKKIKVSQNKYTHKLYTKLEKTAKKGIFYYELELKNTDTLTNDYIEELIQILRFDFFTVDHSVNEIDEATKNHTIRISW